MQCNGFTHFLRSRIADSGIFSVAIHRESSLTFSDDVGIVGFTSTFMTLREVHVCPLYFCRQHISPFCPYELRVGMPLGPSNLPR
jgi:hypothetical protein